MNYLTILYGVLGFLGKGALVILVYYFGRFLAEDRIKKKENKLFAYIYAIGLVCVISLVMWESYGTNTDFSDSDRIFYQGETEVIRDVPAKERNEYGLTIFLSFMVPALLGVASIKKETLIKNANSAKLWSLMSDGYITREEYIQEVMKRKKNIELEIQMLPQEELVESKDVAENNSQQK